MQDNLADFTCLTTTSWNRGKLIGPKDPLGSTMPLERLAQEAFGSHEVAALAEPELDCVAIAVDGAKKIHPPSAHFDICLIDVPLPADGPLASVKWLQQKRSVVDAPPVNGGMIHRHAPLGHHLLQIAQAQAVSQVSPDAQEDY